MPLNWAVWHSQLKQTCSHWTKQNIFSVQSHGHNASCPGDMSLRSSLFSIKTCFLCYETFLWWIITSTHKALAHGWITALKQKFIFVWKSKKKQRSGNKNWLLGILVMAFDFCFYLLVVSVFMCLLVHTFIKMSHEAWDRY